MRLSPDPMRSYIKSLWPNHTTFFDINAQYMVDSMYIRIFRSGMRTYPGYGSQCTVQLKLWKLEDREMIPWRSSGLISQKKWENFVQIAHCLLASLVLRSH